MHAWELTAAASDGEITLTGMVDSHAKKELAETVAKGVRGVTAVENNNMVDYAFERTDPEILTEVEARIQSQLLTYR